MGLQWLIATVAAADVDGTGEIAVGDPFRIWFEWEFRVRHVVVLVDLKVSAKDGVLERESLFGVPVKVM